MQDDKSITIISPTRPGILSAWTALWKYRSLYAELFKQTTMRRFRDTALGPIWLLLRPLIPAIATMMVFTRVVPISTGIPYPLFFMSGYILWRVFSGIVSFVPRAMRMNRGMMKKMYFPRLLVPLASIGIPMAEFFVTVGVFVTLIVFFSIKGEFQYVLRAQFLLFPVLLLLTMLLAVGVGMVMGVLSLAARDFLYTIPYVMQVWMLATPVIYHADLIPQKWRWLFLFNPMAGLIEAAKWSLLGQGRFNALHLFCAVFMVAVSLVATTAFFLRAEDVLMDDI